MIVMQHQRIQGVTVGSTEDMNFMIKAIELHRMRPVIDRIYPFEHVTNAFEHMIAGKHFGKVAISIP